MFNWRISNPIVQTWNDPNQRYASVLDYQLDPIFAHPNSCQVPQLVQRVDNQRGLIPASYSRADKAFYPVNPYNVGSIYAPLYEFDIKSLGQTDALEVASWNNQDPFGTVPLAKTVHSLMSKVGVIQTVFGSVLGTCTLISNDLVMTARHVVEGENIQHLVAKFNHLKVPYKTSFVSLHTGLAGVVEDDPDDDYAIIKLNDSIGQLGYVSLNGENPFPGETALLHYPLEGRLKVSVNLFDQSVYYSRYLRCFHDSDCCSSGGAYFDPLGRFTAIHLGSELAGDGVNLSRYAITLQAIIDRHPNSLLSGFSSSSLKTFLEPYPRQFLLEEEGAKSQRIFTDSLGNEVSRNRRISLTKAKVVAFSKSNLEYLHNNYQAIFRQVVDQCLYITARHAFTRQYAIIGYIESDHLIPHHVWAATKNAKMKNLVRGSGTRPGENEMPAITIPYHYHRNLRTTGGVEGAKEFHAKLIDLCDKQKVHKAFVKCVKEYRKVGIDLTKRKVKRAIKECLKLHVDMKVMDEKGRDEAIEMLKRKGINI